MRTWGAQTSRRTHPRAARDDISKFVVSSTIMQFLLHAISRRPFLARADRLAADLRVDGAHAHLARPESARVCGAARWRLPDARQRTARTGAAGTGRRVRAR